MIRARSRSVSAPRRRAGTRRSLCQAFVWMAVASAVFLLSNGGPEGARASELPPLGCVRPPAWVQSPAERADGAARAPSDRPPAVVSWRHRMLESQAYEELATEWEAYVERHPRDADAWVEWGDALRYAGRYEEGVERYAEAFAVDSSNAAAVAAHCFQFVHDDRREVWEAAHQNLLQAASANPHHADLYYTLWVTASRLRDEVLVEECLRRMVALGDMPRPLLDWGQNMVAGAPEGAIIFTNGDNDTYPPLAYRALTGRREDVDIVNLSLLNTRWYIRNCRDRGLPITLTDEEIDGLRPREGDLVSHQVQRHMAETLIARDWPRPLFYCVTAAERNIALKGEFVIEGLLRRVGPPGDAPVATGGYAWQRIREMLDTVYVLDSARDPYLDWEAEQSVASLISNYALLLGKVGTWLLKDRRPSEAGPYLYRAAELFAIHGPREAYETIVSDWTRLDAGGRLLEEAKRLGTSDR